MLKNFDVNTAMRKAEDAVNSVEGARFALKFSNDMAFNFAIQGPREESTNAVSKYGVTPVTTYTVSKYGVTPVTMGLSDPVVARALRKVKAALK